MNTKTPGAFHQYGVYEFKVLQQPADGLVLSVAFTFVRCSLHAPGWQL